MAIDITPGPSTPSVPTALVTPAGSALDPQIALATCVHAGPGTYALLLGSGVSTGSGVKTGWAIVEDLVRRAAAADGSGPGDGVPLDAQAWWAEHGQGELGYSSVLAALGRTSAARQHLLRQYFEATGEEERDSGIKVPSAAHRAIAQLVRRGSVRVILTTNFDPLTELALEEIGIHPQVIHHPAQFEAATPLVHSEVTVIKLHGDYQDLLLRNTVDELDVYPPAQEALLKRVMDEYGLIVSGWSADWDKALVRAIEGSRVRRYPMFWAHYGQLEESGRRLVAQHGAATIAGVSADELFTGLVRRLEALDRAADVPVSREVAVARLKRALPDPVRRIEVFDLVNEEVVRTIGRFTPERYPLYGGDEAFAEGLRNYRSDCDTLLHLLAAGAFHDDGAYEARWVETLNRLARARAVFTGRFSQDMDLLRLYPAILAVWTMGVAAVLARREELLAPLLTARLDAPASDHADVIPAATHLNPRSRLDTDAVARALSAWDRPAGTGGGYSQSSLLRQECREALRAIEPDDDLYRSACDRFELLASMVAMDIDRSFIAQPWSGEFFFEARWGRADVGLAKRIADEISATWPLLRRGAFDGQPERAQAALTALGEFRDKHGRKW